MTALIDGDSIPYMIGWYYKDRDQVPAVYTEVIEATDQFMNEMLTITKATHYVGFLGGVHSTFRHLQNPDYKATRGSTKPDWYMQWGSIVLHRLKHAWNFEYVEGIEAEDGVSMMSYYYRAASMPYTICHIDKDLNQIPGDHYNYKTKVSDGIQIFQADYNLYTQVLVGDTVDNLPGLPGIGPAKAGKILQKCVHSAELLMATLNAFIATHGERKGLLEFTECYSMVKLLDMPEAGFDPGSITLRKAQQLTPQPISQATAEPSWEDSEVGKLFNFDKELKDGKTT